jgi:hypothetical protein
VRLLMKRLEKWADRLQKRDAGGRFAAQPYSFPVTRFPTCTPDANARCSRHDTARRAPTGDGVARSADAASRHDSAAPEPGTSLRDPATPRADTAPWRGSGRRHAARRRRSGFRHPPDKPRAVRSHACDAMPCPSVRTAITSSASREHDAAWNDFTGVGRFPKSGARPDAVAIAGSVRPSYVGG